jgi:hypothetical protein
MPPKKRLGLKTSITSTGYRQTLPHGWFKHIFHSFLSLQSEKATVGTAPSELNDITIQHPHPQPSNRDTELLPSLPSRFVLSIYGNSISDIGVAVLLEYDVAGVGIRSPAFPKKKKRSGLVFNGRNVLRLDHTPDDRQPQLHRCERRKTRTSLCRASSCLQSVIICKCPLDLPQ